MIKNAPKVMIIAKNAVSQLLYSCLELSFEKNWRADCHFLENFKV